VSNRVLEHALARFARARRATAQSPATPSTFRAVVEQRLQNVERQLDELKGRVNGLLFLLAGTVAVEVVLRLFR
jgi:hypothetical protein